MTNVCDVPNTDLIKEMLKGMLSRDIQKATECLHRVFREGHSTFDILNIMYKVLLGMEQDISKKKFLEIMQ